MKNGIAAVIILGIIISGRVYAYEQSTHKIMSLKAFTWSQAYSQLDRLGVKATDVFSGQIPELLVSQGAYDEDDEARPLNHFFDPAHGGIGLWFVGGYPSPSWEIDGAGGNDLSLLKTKDFLYLALTSHNKTTRDQNYALFFLGIGHAMHHIEDMCQPQHVRGDLHLNTSEWNKEHGLGSKERFWENRSAYELYTKDVQSSLDYTSRMTANSPPVIGYQTEHDFWDNSDSNGIADFTNLNFVSAGTNFLVNDGNVVTPSFGFASPAPAGASYKKLINELPISDDLVSECHKKNLSCTVTFYRTDVNDLKESESTTNNEASSLSVFDQYMEKFNVVVTYDDSGVQTPVDRIFVLNRFNFDTAHTYLIPRAVEYSAALLDHVMRGRLEFKLPEGFRWDDVIYDPARGYTALRLTASNHTPGEDATNGTIELAATYQPAEGGDKVVVKSLPAQGAVDSEGTDFKFDLYDTPIPPDATEVELQVIYRGHLGEEDNVIALSDRIRMDTLITDPVAHQGDIPTLHIEQPHENVYAVVDQLNSDKAATTNQYSDNDGFAKLKLRLSTQDGTLDDADVHVVARFHVNDCYQKDLTGEFMSIDTLPCPHPYSSTEMAVMPTASALSLTNAPIEKTFDFGDHPIPLRAVDLYIQVMAIQTDDKGNKRVSLETVDVYEPTHLAMYNSTDYIFYDGSWLDSTVVASNADYVKAMGYSSSILPRPELSPQPLTYSVGFSPDADPVAQAEQVPAGGYARISILTDRKPVYCYIIAKGPYWFSISDYWFSPTQFYYSAQDKLVYVPVYKKVRDIATWGGSMSYNRYPSNTSGDYTLLGPVTASDATKFAITFQ